MNSKKLLFLAIGLIALSIISAKSAYACSGSCGQGSATSTCGCSGSGCSSTSTCSQNSTSTNCGCKGTGDCKCKENGKECKCNNCKDGNCNCKNGKDCKCNAEGKECKCGNCNKIKEARPTKDNASQQGRLSRMKGWLKGLAFWKKK